MGGPLPEDDLKRIPGVGVDMERHFFRLGIHGLHDLEGADPEELYRRDCQLQGRAVDRCVLYVYRLAAYYASTSDPDPALLRWWRWKDGPQG